MNTSTQNHQLKILILCAANPATNPRPSRMISLLKKKHKVYAMGICASAMKDIKVFSYPAFKKRNLFEEIKLYKNIVFKKYQELIHTPNRLKIIQILQEHHFNLIICHDLVLLPIVLAHKNNAKVLFDAREFYPAQNSTDFRWKLLFYKFNDFLCKTYLPLTDFNITVSKGLQESYKKHYNIDCELFYSLPKYHDITPKPTKAKYIKIIYHGAANPNRKIQNMIEMSQYLQDRFKIDLMLINTDNKYMDFLKKLLAKKQNKNINIIPPVPFEELIPFSSDYDLGLYIIPPTTLNLKYALPNKFFEYIQARLGLIIAPSIELIPFVKTFKNGIITKDFHPKNIATSINSLQTDDIKHYKQNSHKAAKILNLQNNQEKLDSILKQLFSMR
ncbi:capsular biosynthesis protein [Helicobacter sp. 13S00477-4]|uniref:capsular biosynthesis protein n=1 Tax=Helicobacter sp. 13S00477-4 TaxID=1905759 RepID=UPI000BA67E2A|nr:capsular biosynthesis protein [Helicobacter sp. 13S00477-4]PAF52443.1 hypothetical protein BKH44_02665 [Helicobacter sp. 13S00477-4]